MKWVDAHPYRPMTNGHLTARREPAAPRAWVCLALLLALAFAAGFTLGVTAGWNL